MNAPAAGEPTTVAWHGQDELEMLRRPWNELLDRDPDASVFQTHEWVSAWCGSGLGGRLRVLAVRRAGRLAAVAPLAETRLRLRGVRARAVTFAGDPLADRAGILRDPEVPEAMDAAVGAIIGLASTRDVVRLAEVACDSPTDLAISRAAGVPQVRAQSRVTSRAPVCRLDRAWQDVERGFSPSLRTRLKRARAKQVQAGGVKFRRWLPDAPSVPAVIDEFAALEARSWKGRDGVGVLSTPERRALFSSFGASAASRGWLDIATLRLADDRLIAYRFGFRFRGAFLDYNLAHDPEFDRLSAGRTLLDDIVRDSHRAGLASVDASRGRLDPPHLLAEWTPESRFHRTWLLFGNSWRGRWLSFVEQRLRPAWLGVRRGRAPVGRPETDE